MRWWEAFCTDFIRKLWSHICYQGSYIMVQWCCKLYKVENVYLGFSILTHDFQEVDQKKKNKSGEEKKKKKTLQ